MMVPPFGVTTLNVQWFDESVRNSRLGELECGHIPPRDA
jgi:hypothetical protein